MEYLLIPRPTQREGTDQSAGLFIQKNRHNQNHNWPQSGNLWDPGQRDQDDSPRRGSSEH